MRFPYTFAVTMFGGRNWTIFSASVLFIPTFGLAYFVSQPDTPFWLMLLVASTAGLGGGNFASSMANISFFYPDRMKGWALGLNAAGGNIGVSSVQLLTPILMGIGLINLYQATPVSGVYLQNAGLMWVISADHRDIWRDFLHEQPDLGQVLVQGPARHCRAQAYLDHGFHLYRDVRLLHRLFGGVPAADQDAIPGGPPSPSRSSGRWWARCRVRSAGLLADKVGGAIVTFWNFIAMGAATIGVLYFVGIKDFTGFLVMFLILFVTTGVGNGSTYRMIPSIFREENLQKARGKGDAGRGARLEDRQHRERRCAWIHRRGRRLRRLPDPERLRQVDRHDRRPGAGAGNLSGVLRGLPRPHLVVLFAPGPCGSLAPPSLAEARI